MERPKPKPKNFSEPLEGESVEDYYGRVGGDMNWELPQEREVKQNGKETDSQN